MAELSPADQVAQYTAGFWMTQSIYVAAKLGIADLIHQRGPQTAAELAQATGTLRRPLYGLLRALGSLGIFAEDDRGRFILTPMAECLRSDVPHSVRALAIMRGDWQYDSWGQLLHTLQTGQSAFQHLYGQPLFEFLAQHPDKAHIFDAAMTGIHGRETEAMLEAYDFAGIRVLADVGGGNGSLLTTVLLRYPQLHGLLFDLPHVVQRTQAIIEAKGMTDRCQTRGGSFFAFVPPGADAYLLRHIIHDWNDEQALTILTNCRKAMGQEGKLLLVEGVVPLGNQPSVSKYFDLAMMVIPGGMERTEDEYRQLFQAAGFRLARIVPTRTWISVLEGQPV